MAPRLTAPVRCLALFLLAAYALAAGSKEPKSVTVTLQAKWQARSRLPFASLASRRLPAADPDSR